MYQRRIGHLLSARVGRKRETDFKHSHQRILLYGAGTSNQHRQANHVTAECTLKSQIGIGIVATIGNFWPLLAVVVASHESPGIGSTAQFYIILRQLAFLYGVRSITGVYLMRLEDQKQLNYSSYTSSLFRTIHNFNRCCDV